MDIRLKLVQTAILITLSYLLYVLLGYKVKDKLFIYFAVNYSVLAL